MRGVAWDRHPNKRDKCRSSPACRGFQSRDRLDATRERDGLVELTMFGKSAEFSRTNQRNSFARVLLLSGDLSDAPVLVDNLLFTNEYIYIY